MPGWPTTRVAPPWLQGGRPASPWIATSAGLGWRPPSSGVGPFQPGDDVELLATSAWIWIAGVRVERYARGATLEMIGQDGLAITDGQAALRRWVTLVPDQDDAVPWAMSQLTASPMAAGPNDLPVRADASGVGGRAILEPTPAPSDEPTSPLPALEPNPAPGTPVAAPVPAIEAPSDGAAAGGPVRRAAPRWDDPRSITDDGRR